jgi:hypothetical protein
MLLVTGNFAIDKCLAINKLYPEFVEPSHSYLSDLTPSHPKKILVPSYLPSPALAFSQLWKSFFIPEESLPYQRIQQFRGALDILQHASKSFHAASWMFPWDLRLDMAILYAFCRATDDLVDDDKLSKKDRLRNVNLVRGLINSVYSTSERAASQRNVEAFCKQMKLPDWALDAACAFTFVSDAVPKENVLELVRGYEQDLVFKEITNVEDLVDYSECVAGSVGAMCTHLLLNRTRDTDFDESQKQNIVLKAREMGLVSKTNKLITLSCFTHQIQILVSPAHQYRSRYHYRFRDAQTMLHPHQLFRKEHDPRQGSAPSRCQRCRHRGRIDHPSLRDVHPRSRR